MPSGIEAYERKSDKKTTRYSYERSNVQLDDAFLKKIKANPAAWKHFSGASPFGQKAIDLVGDECKKTRDATAAPRRIDRVIRQRK